MKLNPRCTYCMLSRVHFQSKLSTDDEDLINKTIRECLCVLNDNYSVQRKPELGTKPQVYYIV